MVRKNVLHTVAFSLELLLFVCLLAWPIRSRLPFREKIFSCPQQTVCFGFSDGQIDRLREICFCRVYYVPINGTEYAENAAVDDNCREFSSASVHKVLLPSIVGKVRIDFYPKDRNAVPPPPLLSSVKIDSLNVDLRRMHSFVNREYSFSGYEFTVDYGWKGWGVLMVTISAACWALISACAWLYFSNQQQKG